MVCSNQPTDGERSPQAGRATLASHQARSGLGHPEGIPNAAWTGHTVAVWKSYTFGKYHLFKRAFNGPWRVAFDDEEIGSFGMLQAAMKFASDHAQRIEARSDETLQAARPEGQEPDGEADAPNP